MKTVTRWGIALALTCSLWLVAASIADASTPAACRVDDPACNAAPTKVYASDEPSYKGWATIEAAPDTAMCLALYCEPQVSAWKWTQYGWRSASIAHGTSVYAWPFGGGWEWVWVSGRGWFAVRADRVLIRTTVNTCDAGWATSNYYCDYVRAL